MKTLKKEDIAERVSYNTITVNLLLTVFKLFAGIFAHSAAMISDAVHSASDVFSTVIVIIGVRLSKKSSDAEHQYGHERLECVAAILLSVMLAFTGAGIGFSGIKNLTAQERIVIPGAFALAAAVISVIVKEIMFRYTASAAKKTHSGALMADAWHHRSDALSSIGSFIGILGAKIGFPVLDPIAGLIICLFIFKVAAEIFIDAVSKMTDRAADGETVLDIRKLVLSQDGVLEIDDLKTRKFGDKVYIDIEIAVDGEITLNEAHAIAERVHDKIEQSIPLVKHCMVHVNPYLDGSEE